MSAIDDFREASQEPVELSLRVQVQVRPSSLWVGVFRLDGSPRAGGTQIHAARFDRPEGKTIEECAEAAWGLLARWQARGALPVRPPSS